MEDYYDYLEADDIALRERLEQEDLEFLERELLDLEIKLKNTEIELSKAQVSYLTQKRKRQHERAKKEKLQERIDKAIELLQNSQIYNARSNCKTLFIKLIDEEIKILKGE